jgi:hypothetical protein
MEAAEARALLHRVALSKPELMNDPAISAVLAYARSQFQDGQDYDEQVNRSVLLRLALDLAPAEAICYDHALPVKRERLIERYLVDDMAYQPDLASDLSHAVAALFRAWEAERKSVSGLKDQLAERDGNACRACHVSFDSDTPESISREDAAKPYLDLEGMAGPERSLLRCTVDHIEPVTAYGTNDLANLQLLCDLCNKGKGNLDPPLLKHEYDYAGKECQQMPWHFRAQMLYFVLRSGDYACSSCGTRDAELTITKRRSRGGYVRTNLLSICYRCADDQPLH